MERLARGQGEDAQPRGSALGFEEALGAGRECHRLRRLTAELIEVSGAICERRLTDRRPAEPG